MFDIAGIIAGELGVKPHQTAASIKLMDEGATVPFIARYRKEVTGGLDDTQLRTLAERLEYLRELEERRQVILASIKEQGKLTPELEQAINEAETKVRLEDLYLPYRPKRKTKASLAREAGIGPLAESLWHDPTQEPNQAAAAYLNPDKGYLDPASVLEGAQAILMETFSEDAELVGQLRDYVWMHGQMRSRVIEGEELRGAKFADYFDYTEPMADIPSHRILALLRGRKEKILQVKLEIIVPENENRAQYSEPEQLIARHFGIEDRGRPADNWLRDTVHAAWKIKIFTHLETELMVKLKKAAEDEAIKVFAINLKDLLMAAPAGYKAIIGLDPGLRTGVKAAVIDRTGKLVDVATIYPHPPHNKWTEAIETIADLARKHAVSLISIGNGTASRETEKLVLELIQKYNKLTLTRVVVSEAGASVYSASEVAAAEFPGLDVSLRGAVSIARRLQDPLAELVKIDPKAIGVGQYQHDVDQKNLARSLDAIVEDCVNAVGVEVNTASVQLLSRVSGLNERIAQNVVQFRDDNGPFQCREDLRKVARFGQKTFEQAAGFLRITNGTNPLDCTSVHPEAYPLVSTILERHQMTIMTVMGNSAFLKKLDPRIYTDEHFGLPTVKDIISELDKPGRDPRPEFKTASFNEQVTTITDVKAGMRLEGVVTNVTKFGAFVDIGVHQDGLVHISQLADRFVKDPREVVKTGDIVTTTVVDVDLDRKRISLSLKKQLH
ncbi:RNA-binding transcriptional accessory protein [bacterium]|nr:RNA-binding transcriptional accessory protein [bacterium]